MQGSTARCELDAVGQHARVHGYANQSSITISYLVGAFDDMPLLPMYMYIATLHARKYKMQSTYVRATD
jgi:hypothetical protein